MEGQTPPSPPRYSLAQRGVALLFGIACHTAFAAAVLSMVVGLYTGMNVGRGPWQGAAAALANCLLLAQFVVLHSLLLSTRGRHWLAGLVPLSLGAPLGTTTYALIASLQLLITFVFWSPMGALLWAPHGAALGAFTLAYAMAWLFLLKTMSDAGLALQTGFLGWGAVVRGRAPRYRAFSPQGTFRYVRQPIYVAFALILWTAPCWTLDHLILAVVWTVYCVAAPRLKEQRYLAMHGERFARYRAMVPYWLPSRRALDVAALDREIANLQR